MLAFTLRSGLNLLFLTLLVASLASRADSANVTSDSRHQSTILITNANIFDGKNEKLAPAMSVLVEGNKIKKIAKSIPAPAGAELIDAGGRVLMPD